MIRNTLELPPEPEIASMLLSDQGQGLRLVIAPNDSKAGEYFSSLQSFFESMEFISSDDPSCYCDNTRLLFYPSLDILPFELSNPSYGVVADRMLTRSVLCATEGRENIIVVCSVPALFEKIEAPDQFRSKLLSYSTQIRLCKVKLIEDLLGLYYVRKFEVEEVGQFADHGSVVDMFSPLSRLPYRFEFFGGELVSIRLFDPDGQRSVKEVSNCTVASISEACLYSGESYSRSDILERYRSIVRDLDVASQQIRFHEECLSEDRDWPGAMWLRSLLSNCKASILDYLPLKRKGYFLGDPDMHSCLSGWEDEINRRFARQNKDETYVRDKNSIFFESKDVQSRLSDQVQIQRFVDKAPPNSLVVQKLVPEIILPSEHHGKSFLWRALEVIKAKSSLFVSAKDKKQSYKNIIITCSSEERARGLILTLRDVSLELCLSSDSLACLVGPGFKSLNPITITVSSLARGFTVDEIGLLVISERDLLGSRPESRRQRKYPYRKANFREKISNLRQLSPGDFVVHEMYGLGIFKGLRTISYQGEEGEYLEVEYSNADKLYVPVHDFLRIGKYAGPEGKPPVLTKLGIGQWEIQKKKVRDNLLELTSQLLKTVAIRSISRGISFGSFNEEEKLFADQFEYDETIDQFKAIESVLLDMQSDKPMDRLVCGDVGFGKTEVAMRASFKAVNAGWQVAVLVPTTILADQHGRTFKERFGAFPVRIEVLSRFYSPKRNSEILQAVARGEVDIVIGTHRLIQSDVNFKNLGLVIIDEEHRFGVAQKEKLKKLRAEVDILSLSATPIPGTLQMALFGTRDLSVIETAPTSRQVIQTVVREFDESVFRDAILREVSRGGQVYVVHHYISELESIREMIVSLLPEVSISIVHGKVKKAELENIMHGFYEAKFQVLLATHIIESGLDVPNANTMIIIDPENFGLAQLYQLRGRVGRSSTKAYAYLLYKNKAKLSTEALRRLDAMSAIDELGVGFKLALQDMEIRGAGTMLGKDQSGHVQILGYDMYLKILEEAVRIERARREGATIEEIKLDVVDPELKLGIYPSIPKEYVYQTEERVVLYQRACYLVSRLEGELFLEELEDRYGRYPAELIELVDYMILKNILRALRVHKATLNEDYLYVHFTDEVSLLGVLNKLPSSLKIKRELMRIRLHFPDFNLRSLIEVLSNRA